LVHVCYKFGDRRFRSIQGFKGDDFGFGVLVLRSRARRFPDCHQQRQADSGKRAVIAARQRLTLAVVVVVRWSKDLNAIFIMFGLPCTYELME
jgi:hypothetical protein